MTCQNPLIVIFSLTVFFGYSQASSSLEKDSLAFRDASKFLQSADYGFNEIRLVNVFALTTAEAGSVTAGTDLQTTTINEAGLKNQQFALFPEGSSEFKVNELTFNIDGLGSDDLTGTTFIGQGPKMGMGGMFNFNTATTVDGDGILFESGKTTADKESSGLYSDGDINIMWSPADAINGSQVGKILSLWEEDSSTEKWLVNSTGTPSAFSPPVTKRKKLKSVQNGLSKLSKLHAIRYKPLLAKKEIEKGVKDSPTVIGLDAVELEKVFPEMVTTNYQGDKFISYYSLIPVLIEAIKELNVEQADNLTIREEVNLLKKELAELKDMISELSPKN